MHIDNKIIQIIYSPTIYIIHLPSSHFLTYFLSLIYPKNTKMLKC